MHVQIEQRGEAGIASTSEPERFQAGKEAALLLVEEAVEENDGGLEFLGRALEGRRVDETGYQFGGLARKDLLAARNRFRRGIEEQTIQLRAVEKTALHEDTEGILNLGMESGREFVGEITAWRLTDEGLGGGQQGAVAREPDILEGPQAVVIEASDGRERIETASMRVTGQVMELLELAEDGEIG